MFKIKTFEIKKVKKRDNPFRQGLAVVRL